MEVIKGAIRIANLVFFLLKSDGDIHRQIVRMSDVGEEALGAIAESVRTAAIGGLLRTVRLDGRRRCNDFEAYLTRLRTRIIREVAQQLRQLNSLKV